MNLNDEPRLATRYRPFPSKHLSIYLSFLFIFVFFFSSTFHLSLCLSLPDCLYLYLGMDTAYMHTLNARTQQCCVLSPVHRSYATSTLPSDELHTYAEHRTYSHIQNTAHSTAITAYMVAERLALIRKATANLLTTISSVSSSVSADLNGRNWKVAVLFMIFIIFILFQYYN